MSLSLAITSIDALETIVSANGDNIVWSVDSVFANPLSTYVLIYQPNGDAAFATYTKWNTTVEWGVSSDSTDSNVIAVTGSNDINVMRIVAVSATTAEVISAEVMIYPYYFTSLQSPPLQREISLSAFYIQASTNDIRNLLPETSILWTFEETINDYISASYGSDLTTYYDISGKDFISGSATTVSAISFYYGGTSFDVKNTVTAEITDTKYRTGSLSSVMTFNTPKMPLNFNPQIQASTRNISGDAIIIDAIQEGKEVPGDIELIWSTNSSLITGFTGVNLDEYYPLGTPTIQATSILLSTTDLSNIHTYSLSSFTDIYSNTFRPYKTVTESSTLTARVTRKTDENNAYNYTFQSLGITDNILHNISPYQYILWDSSNTTNVFARYSDDSSSYQFGSILVSQKLDNLDVAIIPDIVDNSPKQHIVNFTFSVISGYKLSDGIIGSYYFSFLYNDLISPDYFTPKFRFQYEPEYQTTIYRPTTSSAMYSISNTSILPVSSFGQIVFTFNDAICSIPYDIRSGGIAPTGVIHEFQGTGSYTICSISMAVYASGENYDDYAVKEAISKQIIITDIPIADNFVVYPEWGWKEETSEWEQIVSSYGTNEGNIILTAAPLSAYGLCHTENFFLSSDIDPTSANRWQWNIQDINYPNINSSVILTSPTGWCALKTGANSSYLSVCAIVYTDKLSSDMISLYYDIPEGQKFTNFATTFDLTTADHKKHIQIKGVQDLSINGNITDINYMQLPVPNNIIVESTYNPLPTALPFNAVINSYYFDFNTEFWSEHIAANEFGNNTATINTRINVDDAADGYLSVPKNEKTKINIKLASEYTLQLKIPHPSASDWCLNNINFDGSANSITVTAYPIDPLIYTPNKFVLTGTDIIYENFIQCFPGVNSIIWTDRNNSISVSSCSPYITSYESIGTYDLDLTCAYDYESQIITNRTFTDVINVQAEYLQYNPNISRIYNFSKLSLPYSLIECSMPPNEWVVADTFNAIMQKLNDNLTYLENMSQLYDIPPTMYCGWYGTLYYHNSSARTRWFTNTPYNSYQYNRPELAIDYTFNNLQDCFIKNNIMYISNGTTISILSSDMFGTLIGRREYKTLGDDFINIRSIAVDSIDRIYILDTNNFNDIYAGSKNRIVVFSFDFESKQWKLLYEWGGLGGLSAKNKFNSPSDLHIDKYDMLWVADTNNKCIKKFTKTGGWLKNITSDYFTDEEKPISVTTDTEDNLYVLTDKQILKFNSSNGEFIKKYQISSGAKKISKCQDGGFIYITYSDRIVKFAIQGLIAGTMADNLIPSYVKDYRSAFHDEYRNLYVVNKNHIQKYVDLLTTVSLKLETDSISWPIEKLYVQKNEYIQDWVINRCFQRFWDNLEIFRRSLLGKFNYQIRQTVTSMTYISAPQAPVDFDYCNYDWLYEYGKTVTQDIIFEYEKPIVRAFTPSEYKQLPYEKEEIYIGINEFNASEVYNRLVKKLYECEEVLLEMIND
jgi:hypothetical protein